MPTKANLKHQGTQRKIRLPYSQFYTHKTAPKRSQITRKTYNIFKLTSVVFYLLSMSSFL
jgi:hypothetical protein